MLTVSRRMRGGECAWHVAIVPVRGGSMIQERASNSLVDTHSQHCRDIEGAGRLQYVAFMESRGP